MKDMNDVLNSNPIQEYKRSLRRKLIHQSIVIGVENHELPHGKKVQCAIVGLNNGLKGIIYSHQFDRRNYRSMVGFIDHKIDFMVLDVKKMELDPEEYEVFNEEKGIVLLSRVQALDEMQEEFWETAQENHIVTGTVKGFEDERLYILVKGVACVLPIQDYDYDWNQSGKKLIPIGTELTVKIINIDRVKKQVRVSRKELLVDPWSEIHENFGVGNYYPGVITSVVENVGIFVKLKAGVESLAWFPDKVPNHGSLVGKKVSVLIKNIDQNGRRMRSRIVNFPHEIY